MKTQLRIENHEHEGKQLQAVLQSVAYDSKEKCWRARAIWRGHQFMKRARISSPTIDGLVSEAIKALSEK